MCVCVCVCECVSVELNESALRHTQAELIQIGFISADMSETGSDAVWRHFLDYIQKYSLYRHAIQETLIWTS